MADEIASAIQYFIFRKKQGEKTVFPRFWKSTERKKSFFLKFWRKII
jgi:hypothetical protein